MSYGRFDLFHQLELRQYYCNISSNFPAWNLNLNIPRALPNYVDVAELLCDVSQFVRWKIINNFVKTSLKMDWQLAGRERERGEQIRISRAGGLDQLSWGERREMCKYIIWWITLKWRAGLRLRLRLEMRWREGVQLWLYSGHCRHQPSWRQNIRVTREEGWGVKRYEIFLPNSFYFSMRNVNIHVEPIKDRQRRQLAAPLRNNPIWALLIRSATVYPTSFRILLALSDRLTCGEGCLLIRRNTDIK